MTKPEEKLQGFADQITQDKEDIHRYDRRLQRQLEMLADHEDLTESQKDFAVQIYEYLQTRSSGNKRDYKYMLNLKKILAYNDFDFQTLEQENEEHQSIIRSICSDIEQSAYSNSGNWKASTKADYYAVIKRIMEHHNLPGKQSVNKLLPAGFSAYASRKNKSKTQPEDIPSPSDVKKICRRLQTSNTEGVGLRNSALCLFLFDSGCRIGEALDVDVGDVDTTGRNVTVDVSGNKGSRDRTVELPQAGEIIKRWKHHGHPMPKQDNHALFPALAGETKGKQSVSYNSIIKQFKKANNSADTDCKLKGEPNHIFRKAMETWYDNWNWLSSTQIDNRLGVQPGGSRKKEYNRPKDSEINSRLMQNAGIVDEEDSKMEEPILPLECVECGKRQSGHRITCIDCGHSVSDNIGMVETSEPSKEEAMQKVKQFGKEIQELKKDISDK